MTKSAQISRGTFLWQFIIDTLEVIIIAKILSIARRFKALYLLVLPSMTPVGNR